MNKLNCLICRVLSLALSAALVPAPYSAPAPLQNKLSPASFLALPPAPAHASPIFEESELTDPSKYLSLIEALMVNPHAVLFCPAKILKKGERVSLANGIEMNEAQRKDFFRFCVASQNGVVFLFAQQERVSEIRSLLKETPGESLVVILPYSTEEGEAEILLKTQRPKSNLFPNLALESFFQKMKMEGLEIKATALDPDSEPDLMDSTGLRAAKGSLLPLLAAYPQLSPAGKKILLETKNEKNLIPLARRSDLAMDEIIWLVEYGTPSALKELVRSQKECLSSHPSLAKRLIQKLFSSNRTEASQFLLDYSSNLTGMGDDVWFLKAVVSTLFDGSEEAKKIKSQILDNPLLPLWVKGRIVESVLTYPKGSGYADAICAAASDRDFLDWYWDHSHSRDDIYGLWLGLVLTSPEFASMRQKELLDKLKFHHDRESLRVYRDFLADQEQKGWEKMGCRKPEDAQALVRLLNSTITSHIPERKTVFTLSAKVVTGLKGNSLADFVSAHVGQGKESLDPSWVLPLLAFFGDDPENIDAFKKIHAAYHIFHSRDLRSDIANELVLAATAPQLKPLILKLLSLTKEGFNNKRKQKIFVKSFQTLNTLHQLADLENISEQNYFKKLEESEIKTLDQFLEALQNLFIELMKEELPPDQKEALSETDMALRARKVIGSYLVYKANWKKEHPSGIADLKKVVMQYLLTGKDVKDQKYGKDPDFEASRKQMEALRAVLVQNLRERLKDEIEDAQREQKVQWMADTYVRQWQEDFQEEVFPFGEGGMEPQTVWTTDKLEDWINLGVEGPHSCLRADSEPELTRSLNGRMLSGVCKTKYIGKDAGDKNTRVQESLVFRESKAGPEVILDEEQIVSTLSSSDDKRDLMKTVEVAVRSALRDAGRYGATRIVLPVTFGFTGLREAFWMLRDQLDNAEEVIDHRDALGRLLFREKIRAVSMRDLGPDDQWTVLKERNRWRMWVGCSKVNGEVPVEGLPDYIVDGKDKCKKMELAGVPCEGMRLTLTGLEVQLHRKVINFWAPALPPAQKKKLPQKVKVLSESSPEILQELKLLLNEKLNPGKRLNIVYRASEKLIEFMESREKTGSKKVMRVIMAIPRSGVPVARILKDIYRKQRVTGHIRVKEGRIIHQYIPAIQKNRKKTLFIVDQVILKGNTIINCIAKLKEHGFEEGEIVVLSLTAYPEGLENILKAYPNLKGIYVGAAEDELHYGADGKPSALAESGERTHPLVWSKEAEVNLAGKKYKILHRIQSKNSYNLFLAENEAGEKVVIKTVVSEKEAQIYLRIASSVGPGEERLGILKVIQYDPENAALVTDYVDGATYGKMMQDTTWSLPEKVRAFNIFIANLYEVVQFLKEKNLMSIYFALENIRWSEKNKRWVLTNFNISPSIKDPKRKGTERDLALQTQKVVEFALKVLMDECHQDKKMAKAIMHFYGKVKSLEPARISDLDSAFQEMKMKLKKIQKKLPGELEERLEERSEKWLQAAC